MAYCTVADMALKIPENVIISLSNDSTGATAIDAENVADAIAAADAEIDGYIAFVKTVPLDPVPPLIKDMSAIMAIWNLHKRKYFNSDVWKDAYEHCQKILLRIAEGKLVLNDATAVDATPVDLAYVSTRRRRFTPHVWRQFR